MSKQHEELVLALEDALADHLVKFTTKLAKALKPEGEVMTPEGEIMTCVAVCLYFTLSQTEKAEFNAQVAKMKAEGKDVGLLEATISMYGKCKQVSRSRALKLINS
jgi:proline racemase